MGFKSIDHRFGAILFIVLISLSVPAAYYSALPYQMAFIGSLFWVILKFSLAKNADDKANKKFNYLKYADHEFDNLMVNVVGIFICTPQMRNIVNAISDHVHEVEFTDLWFYAVGVLCDGAYILAIKVATIKKKYEGEPKE